MLPIDLFLVRHGQSEGNAAKRLSEKGDHSAFSEEFRERHTSDFRLTEEGRRQARAAGAFLVKELSAESIDRFYVSEYARAKETAGLLLIPNALWYPDSYLSERDWGDCDSLPENERKERFGDALERRKKEPFFWRPPNGESFNQLCLRVDRFLDTLHRECSDKRVLVVCHGEVMRAMQIRLERISQEMFRYLTFSDISADRIHNCQITHYTRRDPETNKVAPYIGWVRWYRPAENPMASTDWHHISRKLLSNSDLLAEVDQIEQCVY